MASASRGESSNPYGGGLGTGGKFRKPAARRSQKTPYERPPTSVRGAGVGGGREDRGGGGWLSKLVDPAQRLITYSAHKLFASVFRKRLVSGETPLQSPEQQQQQVPERDVIQETRVAHMESTPALSMKNDVVRIQEANASGNPGKGKDGFTDLEKFLKEKTFTRFLRRSKSHGNLPAIDVRSEAGPLFSDLGHHRLLRFWEALKKAGFAMKKQMLDDRRFPNLHLNLQCR